MNYTNSPPGVAKSKNSFVLEKETMVPFYLILAFLFLEYARPQLLIPALKYLHLPAITVILISLFVVFSGKLNIKDKQTLLYIVLLAEMVIHGPIAVNNYWTFVIFYSMSMTFIVYLAIIIFVNDHSKYEKLIRFWLIIFIFLAIIGIVRRGVGVGGFIGDENDFCMALNMILPFTLFGLFSAKGMNRKIYMVILTGLFLFVIILTESRGGFVGLVSVLFYCWLKSNKKIILAIILTMIVGFSFFVAPEKYWDEVRSISTEKNNPTGTGAQRIYAWKLGWRIFLDNPVIGVGQGNYPWRVWETEQKLGVQWQERSLAGRAAHSLYFTLFSELGLVGTISYFLMVIFTFKDIKTIKRKCRPKIQKSMNDISKNVYYLALALEGSLIGFLASSVFISTLYYPNFWILCGFIITLRKLVLADPETFYIQDKNISGK